MTALNNYGTEVTAVFVGQIKDPEWPHFAWTVTLTREGKSRTLPYRMGLGHVQTKCGKPYRSSPPGYQALPCQHSRCSHAGPQPVPPTLYDVLCSFKADATHGETFEDWAADLGYDTDSRKALDQYLACQASERESAMLFGLDWPRIKDDEDYS